MIIKKQSITCILGQGKLCLHYIRYVLHVSEKFNFNTLDNDIYIYYIYAKGDFKHEFWYPQK